MGVRVERFPEYGVTLCVYSGIITAEVVREELRAFEPGDVVRRINYADPTTDLSGVDMASFPELKRALAARLKELLAGKRGVAALVSDAKAGRQTPDFWVRYLGQDTSYPVEVRAFECLEDACAWLGLPEAGCRAVIATAKGRAPRHMATDSDPASASSDDRPGRQF